jgi:hypothetical protein
MAQRTTAVTDVKVPGSGLAAACAALVYCAMLIDDGMRTGVPILRVVPLSPLVCSNR